MTNTSSNVEKSAVKVATYFKSLLFENKNTNVTNAFIVRYYGERSGLSAKFDPTLTPYMRQMAII